MQPAGPSLRLVLGTTLGFLIAISIGLAASLVLLTSRLQRDTETIGRVVESVRLAEEIDVDLLVLARVTDPVKAARLEAEVLDLLDRAGSYAESADERRVHGDARTSVERFLAAPDEEALEEAHSSVRALVAVHVERASAVRRHVERLDAIADVAGATSAGVLVALSGVLLAWFRSRVGRPLLDLAGAMSRFGSGDRRTRSAERGAREIATMARQFNRMASDLEEERQRQFAFLATVAHDLKNPISALALSAQIVRPEAPLPPEATLRGLFERIERQTVRLNRLLGDLVDLAAIEAGRLEIALERWDLRAVVTEAAGLHGGTSSAHRIELDLPEAPVQASCDPHRIAQVLGNLLENAIKYSPDGGRVHVRLERRGDRAAIRVEDQGIGIPADELSGLFEPFRRGRSKERRIGGSGLGLYAARRLVEAHGGRIEVDSAPGGGSVFTVELPLGG